MKIKIHKYRLGPVDSPQDHKIQCVVEMPYEAKLLDAGYSALEPVVWAQFDVDHEQRLVKRVFHVLMTGEEYEIEYNKLVYFRTIRHPASQISPLFFHIFHELW